MEEKYRTVLLGVFLGLATLLFAEFMASTFGLYEKDIKGALYEEALEHTTGVVTDEPEEDSYRKIFKDKAEAQKVAKKAWVYLKRAHSHGEGLGAIVMALCLVIAHTRLKPKFKRVLSAMIGLGGFGYPFCWFFAGTYMVDLGKAAAKSQIHWLAVSSVSMYLGGMAILFGLLLLSCLKKNSPLTNVFFEKMD